MYGSRCQGERSASTSGGNARPHNFIMPKRSQTLWSQMPCLRQGDLHDV